MINNTQSKALSVSFDETLSNFFKKFFKRHLNMGVVLAFSAKRTLV